MENLTFIGFVVGICLVAFLAIGLIVAKLYRRASKELSFVRTGLGGQKVIMNGGAIRLPVFHEIIPVNMNTLRLEVRRANELALITRDRMRVDVQAEFYVRVKPTEEAIADAAQTLGRRTLDPEALKELVEAKFVDALRAVAAEMAMQELHEQRVNFVQKVQTAVSEDLLKNGLELESVSLTSLDQTKRDFFNPNNAFDAEGLTKLTEEIETRRKLRNDIEQDTQVAVQIKNLEAERQKLNLSRDEEYARLEQEREVAIRRAAQAAEIAREQALKNREAQEAEIAANQEVEKAKIVAEKAVEEERIESERQVKEREIAKVRALEAAEIEKKKAIEGAEIEKKKVVENSEVDKKKTIELAEQDKQIAVAEKSKALSETQAEADQARALAVKAQEQVETARETEKAERDKRIELILASQEAEREAIGITVAAETEKKAADDRAAAVRTLAEAESDKARIGAQGEAEAEKLRAQAAELRYAVDAEGQRALHEADNLLSQGIVDMRVKLALLEHLAEIVRESVKPLERIEGIKIFQLDGFGMGSGTAGGGNGGGTAAGGNLAEQVVASALRYRAQAPLVDSLLNEVGLAGGDLESLTRSLMARGEAVRQGSEGPALGTESEDSFEATVPRHPPAPRGKADSKGSKKTKDKAGEGSSDA
jgi:uncharacterized membrane protein YqiK